MVQLVNIYIKDFKEELFESENLIPNLVNGCLVLQYLLVEDKQSGVLNKMNIMVLRLLILAENHPEMVKSAEKMINYPLLEELGEGISRDKKSSNRHFSRKEKLFVEIYLKAQSLHERLCEHTSKEIGHSYVNSSLISRAKRAMRVMSEKNNFKFLSYYHFFKDLKTEQRQMLDTTIETQHNSFDVKTMARLEFDQCQKFELSFNQKDQLMPFSYIAFTRQSG